MSGNPSQDSLGTLVGRVIASGQRLARAQVALVQAEARQTGEQVAQVGVLALVAVSTASLFVVFLLIAIAYVIVALGLPTWAGFGIVALVLLATTIVVAVLAKKRADSIRSPKAAVAEIERTADALSDLGRTEV